MTRRTNAGVAQLVEQLICNQQVAGSSPITSSTNKRTILCPFHMGEFPSGQRGQTVNLLRLASMVRIHPLPPNKTDYFDRIVGLFFLSKTVEKPQCSGFSLLHSNF